MVNKTADPESLFHDFVKIGEGYKNFEWVLYSPLSSAAGKIYKAFTKKNEPVSKPTIVFFFYFIKKKSTQV